METYENNGWQIGINGTKRINTMEKYAYLVGTKINKWQVISIEHTRRHPDAICQCECGTIKTVDIGNLINGRSKDCGCGRKKKMSDIGKMNLVGKRFGKLQVVEMLNSNKDHKQLCKCKCDCGNETVVIASSLTSKHTLSCGCLNSYYNMYIKKYLTEIGVRNQPEFTVHINDKQYRFDFYLPDYNTFIEYDGSQHYTPARYCGNNHKKNMENFQEQIKRDKIKNDYCADNHINLLRIPYWESNNIKTIINNHLQRLNEKGFELVTQSM